MSWVRVTLSPEGARGEVIGTVHRRPVTRAVPLRTAVALLAAGVPGVVRPAAGSQPVSAPRVTHVPARG